MKTPFPQSIHKIDIILLQIISDFAKNLFDVSEITKKKKNDLSEQNVYLNQLNLLNLYPFMLLLAVNQKSNFVICNFSFVQFRTYFNIYNKGWNVEISAIYNNLKTLYWKGKQSPSVALVILKFLNRVNFVIAKPVVILFHLSFRKQTFYYLLYRKLQLCKW